MTSLSRSLDETLALLDVASSPELQNVLRARKAQIERRLFSPKTAPAKRPEPETWAIIRKAILARQEHRCGLCLADDRPLDAHHLVPVAQGGETVPQNLIALCRECHATIHPWLDAADAA